jgi:predicted  nucleic acid-binding Zn-ribbon protein
MSQVLDLLTLQGFDDEAAALRAALADVERRLGGDEELDDARRALATAETAAREVHRQQKLLEDEVERRSDKIAPEEKRLYDGSVKNPKELASIQHEIEFLRAERGKFEDQLIEVLTRRETIDTEHLDAKKLVEELEARREHQQQDLRHEARRLNDMLARVDARREAQKSKIDSRALRVYEEVRRRKGGMAVARIQGGSCMGCRITIPDALRRRALSTDTLAQCPNCERILYIG